MPRSITVEYLESQVAEEYFLHGREVAEKFGMPASPSVSALTVCILVMRSGFVVVGHSAPIEPSRYDREMGQRVARQRCMEQLWQLEGYAAKIELARLPEAARQPLSPEAWSHFDSVRPTFEVRTAAPTPLDLRSVPVIRESADK